jgi:hypothetical protein
VEPINPEQSHVQENDTPNKPTYQDFLPQQLPVMPPRYNAGYIPAHAYGPAPVVAPEKPAAKKILGMPQWVLAVIAGVLLVLCCGCAFLGVVASGSKTSTSTPTSTASISTATPGGDKRAPNWVTVQTFKGNGNQKTASFSVGNNWKINWSCDPSSFDGLDYNVIASVDSSDGSSIDFGTINTMCKSGNTSGTTTEHRGGNVYLDILSEGDWTMQVQEYK